MRRIQRAIDKEDVVRGLTGGEAPVFKEIWRLLLFAATVGYKRGRREPLGQVESGKAMPQSYFSNNPAWPGLLYLLGLVVDGLPDILVGTEAKDDARLNIFEEFANGGLAILREELEHQSDTLDTLLQFISAMEIQAGFRHAGRDRDLVFVNSLSAPEFQRNFSQKPILQTRPSPSSGDRGCGGGSAADR
jgi:dnd system-associated protein 4